MKSELEIRLANENDFDWIYRFVTELEETEFDAASVRKAYDLNINNPDYIYLVAEIDDVPVGYLSCHAQLLLHHGGQKIAEIQEMYVLPESRKKGAGKKMIDELKRISKEIGIEQLEVTSSFGRIDAHRFYEREGFVHTSKKFTWKVE